MMNSAFDFCSSSSPVAARRVFSMPTQSLKLATRSSLLIEAFGISTPMPLMMTRFILLSVPLAQIAKIAVRPHRPAVDDCMQAV